ncbi:MAG: type IX secretion system protein PorQ [Prevotella sp.]|nr:type IX secretion system protein PorQ [Prevotella sp.]
MKKNILFLLLFLIPALTKAQDSQTGYNFLRLPVSAHVAALGGYNITLIEDDPSLIFHNPALLATVSDKSLNLNFMTYMEGVTTASAAFNRIVKEKASWAVMAQYMDYGSMKEVDENNVQTGDFSARDIAISGAFSYLLTDRLVGGITAKFITSYIGSYSSIAVGVDLGLNYYDPEHEWSVSLVAKNLGGEVDKFDDEYLKMPIDVQAGVSKRFGVLPFRVSITMDDLNHWDYKFINHFILGVDILITQQIYIAGGYNFRHANEMAITNNDDEKSSHGAAFSFGAGLQLERFKLQVAYAKYHVSSNSLSVNVSYNF